METIKDIKNFDSKNCLENQAFHVKSWLTDSWLISQRIYCSRKAITVLYNGMEGATVY